MSETASTYSPCPQCLKLNRAQADGRRQPVCGACKVPLPLHGAVNTLNASQLQALIAKSPLPVVVDFWAPWCGPCRMFAPTFESASLKLTGKVVFAKLDTESHPDGAAPFGIRSIPTLIYFHSGKEVSRQSGALPEPQFLQWLASMNRT